MDRKEVKIFFKNKQDFRDRIAGIFQNQKHTEVYNFEFADEETKKEFDDLVKTFCIERIDEVV